jgi:hypothetical protein
VEVIDAFIDGERVDTDELKAALADASGRDYFVDAWLLREAVRAEPVAEHKTVASPVASRPRRTSWWLVAAAFAATLVGGYTAGQNFGRHAPVTGSASSTVTPTPTTVPSSGPFPVPVPTRVIQLEFRSTASSGGD